MGFVTRLAVVFVGSNALAWLVIIGAFDVIGPASIGVGLALASVSAIFGSKWIADAV